jgi:hypothetical protein
LLRVTDRRPNAAQCPKSASIEIRRVMDRLGHLTTAIYVLVGKRPGSPAIIASIEDGTAMAISMVWRVMLPKGYSYRPDNSLASSD